MYYTYSHVFDCKGTNFFSFPQSIFMGIFTVQKTPKTPKTIKKQQKTTQKQKKLPKNLAVHKNLRTFAPANKERRFRSSTE